MNPSERPELLLSTIISFPFEENTYLAQLAGRPDCLVIDPGLEPDKILAFLDEKRLVPGAILNTHGHGDHVGGNAALKRRWPDCPVVIGEGDAPMLTNAQRNLSAMFGVGVVSPPADQLVKDGDVCRAAGFELEVLDIPGHSPGHVAFVWKGRSPYVAFVGDILFAGGVGRTDFPGGSFKQLAAGIREKLFTLPEDTVVLSGHGPATTIGEEKHTNPFVGEGVWRHRAGLEQ